MPATKLVGLPVKEIPSIVYVDGAGATAFVPVLAVALVPAPMPVSVPVSV